MSEAIEIPLDGDSPLVDPPIIDLLAFNPDRKAYAITFIPEDRVSPREKETVEVRPGTEDGRRVEVRLHEVAQLVGGEVRRISHCGGGEFTFELAGGKSFRLSENAATSDVTQRLYDHLQDLGMVAQIAYLDTRLNRARTA